MARTNPTDLVVTDSTSKPDDEESARWTTRPAPDVPWSEHTWPETGLRGDQFWAALFRCSIDRFHRLVARHNLMHLRIGHVVFVDAGYLREQMSILGTHQPAPDPPRKPKRKTSPRGKASTEEP